MNNLKKEFLHKNGYEPVCLDCKFYKGIIYVRTKKGGFERCTAIDAYCSKYNAVVVDCLSPICKKFEPCEDTGGGDYGMVSRS